MENRKNLPIRVTEHLFQLGTSSFPVYLSIGETAMIIEGGTGPTAHIIARQIRELGIDPAKIRYIALTHTHPDHVGAVPRLKRLWPHVEVLASPKAIKTLKKETFVQEFLPADRIIGQILMARGDIEEQPQPLDTYWFEADIEVESGQEIDLGAGIVWRSYETPGHSPCHLSWFENKESTMVIGDMTGFFHPEFDLFWPNYFQSLENYCDSIRKMMSLRAEHGLLSHNGVIAGGVRKHLEKALKATEAYHLELMDRVDRGEDTNKICADKADWVVSLGALTSYRVINALCRLFLKRSQEEREKALFHRPLAANAT